MDENDNAEEQPQDPPQVPPQDPPEEPPEPVDFARRPVVVEAYEERFSGQRKCNVLCAGIVLILSLAGVISCSIMLARRIHVVLASVGLVFCAFLYLVSVCFGIYRCLQDERFRVAAEGVHEEERRDIRDLAGRTTVVTYRAEGQVLEIVPAIPAADL